MATVLTAQSGYAGDSRVLRYRQMTIREARHLTHGEHHVLAHNGVIRRVRLNGVVKTWKRDIYRISVPLKYGLYESFRDTGDGRGYMAYLIILIDEHGNDTRDEFRAEVH